MVSPPQSSFVVQVAMHSDAFAQTFSGAFSCVRQQISPSDESQGLSSVQKRGQSEASTQALPKLPKAQQTCPSETSHAASELQLFGHSF
jgi:hypothetical protein